MPDKSVKVTINLSKDQDLHIQQWPIKPFADIEENNRISIEWRGTSYSFVMDEKEPRMELWNVDASTEIKDIAAVIRFPKVVSPT